MKIGFACKLSEFNSKKQVVSIPRYNFKTTTIKWLNSQDKDVAVAKLFELLQHNILAVSNLIKFVSTLPTRLQMVRLGSDMLPAYTHSNWSWFWQQSDIRSYLEKHLSPIGEFARANNIRLSFHPGQFCCLASDKPEVVANSIAEFEYHADVARYMGYGKTFQDFKINVHISGKQGYQGILNVYPTLSDVARNCITIENEEITHGLDQCLLLANKVPIVLDLHHHFIMTGEYIQPDDPRVTIIQDSWKNVRPVIHLSVSSETLLQQHNPDVLPDLTALLSAGYTKSKLRAHSIFMWNNAVNKWALQHNDWADIMVECKSKNLGSFQFYSSRV